MTLIGPRPESPDLAEAYPPEAQEIFSVKPGLVGPNQILGRNEEEFYPPGVDAKTYYLEELLPQKLPLDLQYIREKSFLSDLKYLFLGAWVTITGAISRQHVTDNLSQLIMIAADALLCPLSLLLAYYIRYETWPTLLVQARFPGYTSALGGYQASFPVLFRLLPDPDSVFRCERFAAYC